MSFSLNFQAVPFSLLWKISENALIKETEKMQIVKQHLRVIIPMACSLPVK